MRYSLVLAFLILLVGCDDAAETVPQVIRPIAWTAVESVDLAQVRRLSGTLKAARTASLSFEVGGKTATVAANLGDVVGKGALLAEIDDAPYQLNLNAARGALQEARAALHEAENSYRRQKQLFDKGWIAQAALDNAIATLDSARSNVNIAQAQFELAERDLTDTRLLAPYDGRITTRSIEPSQQVAAGQPVFEIEGQGGLEVSVMVPETIIQNVHDGQTFEVTFAGRDALTAQARVTEIGPRAQASNAFPITLALAGDYPSLRSGMSAEVNFTFEGRGRTGYTGKAMKVPITALLPGNDQDALVFVFDPDSGTVSRRSVQTENIIDNEVLISSGLEAGEIIATAGVAFLREGQKVRLFDTGVRQFNQ
ncbi:efflux RND transporter periplasmic adaptor subunit [Hwanghaeella grinnelliae]|uniref:Efflux RND transporter periplasmic adaptor subunit n=2 Tax=Hwanghaeella grinnelliae TaxID=2500179 RepID=A0A437QZ28_9PROT|nr:efflux RND transporter periplasmic adaptor subunit [Hwanghaeella grinnelliae]